jgi:hypothetical protein
MVRDRGVSQRVVSNLISGAEGLSYAKHAKEHEHGPRRQCCIGAEFLLRTD